MIIKALPFYVVNTTTITVPALVWVVPAYGGLYPSSAAGFADSSGVQFVSGYKPFTATVNRLKGDKDLDSHLWTPTNATIPTTEQFGLYYMGMAVACTANTPVWRYTTYFDVEFKIMA